MRTASKIVLIIIIITLVYSVVKLINASTHQTETVTITLPMPQSKTVKQNNQSNTQVNQAANTVNTTVNSAQNTVSTSTQKLYHADEILIDGQGKAGQNYIDITSTTPITPEQKQQTNSTQNNTQNNNSGYVQTPVIIDETNTNTSAQTYAPGVPAFEVIDGN